MSNGATGKVSKAQSYDDIQAEFEISAKFTVTNASGVKYYK